MVEEGLTHVDERGKARMVDVGAKAPTRRVARAGARVWMQPGTMRLLQERALPKGDVLAVARMAGIMAAKKTPELVPLCHPLSISRLDVSFQVAEAVNRVDIECVAEAIDRTGVEMEAIIGATVAAVTIYDMCKAVDRDMVIGDIRLLEKTGGKEDYVRAGGDMPASETAPGSDRDTVSGAVLRGEVVSVNLSPGKGERKTPVDAVQLAVEHGIVGDGHSGTWHRQVSLLGQESIDKMVAKGLEVGPGDFAENVTTRGVHLVSLPIGTRLTIGPALVEVTQIGKVCHDRCAIYRLAGDCVMPREGIFVRVLRGGQVAPGDEIVVAQETAGAAPGHAGTSGPLPLGGDSRSESEDS